MFGFNLPPKLLNQIGRYERDDLLDKLVGLGLSPEYQANAARIQTLIHVALIEARGQKRPTRNDLAALLNGFEGHPAQHDEDPPEDVFISAVSTPAGQFRIFNGIFPGADYSLQRLLDVVLAQDFQYRDSLARQCNALLCLSDAVAERCKFALNEYAESRQWRDDWPLRLPLLLARGAAARFTDDDLVRLGIGPADLEPFRAPGLEGLLHDNFGETLLNRWPVVGTPDGIHLPIASFVSPALRMYLSRAVANGVVPAAAEKAFHVHQLSRWLGVDLPTRKARPLKMEPLHLPEVDFDLPGGGLSQAVLRFDEDKLAHLFVIECTWDDPPQRNIHDGEDATASQEEGIANYLRAVRKKLEKDFGTTRGLTLVVQDSPGWTIRLSLPDDFGEEWYCTGFPARSFATLLADHTFSLIDLWKMLREVREMEAKGVIFTAWLDMLNYWSIWRSLGSTFWSQNIDLRKFGSFGADSSQVVETMRRIRQETNPHAARLPNGKFRRVERWVEEFSPSQDRTKPIYLEPMSVVLGELRSVVETDYGVWWVASARPPFDPEDRQLLYLIWQASAEWLLLLARSGNGRLSVSAKPIEIRLLPVPKSIPDAAQEIELLVAEGVPVVTIILPPSFPDRLMTPDNAGERLLIRALVDGLLAVLRHSLSEEARVQWVIDVAADPDLKMIHITPGGDHGYAADLLADKLSPRLLQEADLRAAERFLRDAIEAVPISGMPHKTASMPKREEVQSVLRGAVDVHWSRCKALLSELDCESTLVLLSRLIEALHRERVQSERGSAARSRHYKDSPEYPALAMIALGRRDRSFQTYRFIAEMALCECPHSGGRVPGLTDIDRLAGEVAKLVEMAHNSDAIDRGLIVSDLKFRPDGAIEMADGGALAFIESYTAACLQESIALDVDAYAALFEPMPEDQEALLREDDPFQIAFRAEFGLGLREAFEVRNSLQAVAIAHKRDVLAIRRSVLEKEIHKHSRRADLTAMLSPFLMAFGLEARRNWDAQPPPPYSRSDVWPWLFERRLSLMLRPVLTIRDTSDDPSLIFGVRQLDVGIRYAATLLETGNWPSEKLSSAAARTYANEEVNRRGRAFEQEISEILRRGGWHVVESVPMKRLGAPKQLGDVDVLAVSSDNRRWWVIECKRFGAARTPREIANWLNDFRGHDGDKLDRHLKRCAWIRQHQHMVAERLKLPVVPNVIEPKIVTTSPVPLTLQKDLPPESDVLTKRELVAACRG
jgi:hypothetical protein